MKLRTLLFLSAALLSHAGAGHAEDFTCWPVSYPLAAAADGYWTPERRAHAISTDSGAWGKTNPVLVGEKKADVTKTPYKYGGKLFFTVAGVDYSGSAQFAGREDIIVTAAHNVYDGGKKSENIRFFRGYADGGGTEFKVEYAAVLTAWTKISKEPQSYKKAQFDYAVLRAKAKSDAGYFAITTESDFIKTIVMGYPGAFDDAKYMYEGETQKWARVDNTYVARPPVLGPGSSGGAWFVGDEDSGFSLVSVVSGGGSTEMLGPVMTMKTVELIDYVSNRCQ